MSSSLKLSEVCQFKKGKKVNVLTEATATSIPYLLIDTLRGMPAETFTEDKEYTKAIEDDVLIVCDGANSGLVGTGLKGAVGSTIARLRIDKKRMNKDYFMYFLRLNFSKLNIDIKGAAIPHLKQDKMLNLIIRSPDIKEQKIIVDEIEKQFTRLDASVKDLRSVKEKLEVYRKSVLNKTYKGNSNWIKSTIGDSICKIEQVVPQNSDFKEFTYIDIASIDNTKQKIVNQNKIMSSDAPSRARQLTSVGDIVFSTVRTYLKNIAIIPEINGIIISSTGFAVLRPKKTINRNFVFYYLLSDKLLREINKMQVGTSYPAIRKNDLLDYEFSYPESELEQEKIIGDVESHFSVIDKLEQTVNSSLLKTDQLRKSILKSAFEGKLVKTKPL